MGMRMGMGVERSLTVVIMRAEVASSRRRSMRRVAELQASPSFSFRSFDDPSTASCVRAIYGFLSLKLKAEEFQEFLVSSSQKFTSS